MTVKWIAVAKFLGWIPAGFLKRMRQALFMIKFPTGIANLRIVTAIAAAGLCLALQACAPKPKPDEEKPPSKPSQAPQIIGRIATIPPGKRFVLIQSYGPWKMQPGTILTTRGPESRSANLRVTGESLGQFAAADLQSGEVEVGDPVYSRHVPKPPAPEPAPLPDPAKPAENPENQLDLPVENVQKNN
jgi:hypothetical protein